MNDRLADGYEPHFDIDAKIGHQGELFVQDLIRALGQSTIEVKNDQRAAKAGLGKQATGNIYLETRCRYGSDWMPSGIASTQAEYWAHIVGDEILVVAPTDLFLKAARTAYKNGQRRSCLRGSHPTEGVTIPLGVLLPALVAAQAVKP